MIKSSNETEIIISMIISNFFSGNQRSSCICNSSKEGQIEQRKPKMLSLKLQTLCSRSFHDNLKSLFCKQKHAATIITY